MLVSQDQVLVHLMVVMVEQTLAVAVAQAVEKLAAQVEMVDLES
jgi:hypothetical protein